MMRVVGPGRSGLGSGRLAARATLCLALAGTMLAVAVPPANAVSFFGWNPFGSDEPAEPPSPDAQPYSIEIAVSGVDDDLADRLRASSLLWTERERDPPPSTASFLSRVNAEYGRLVGALYAEGYYGGVVTITVAGRDPAAIPFDAVLPKPAAVAVTIEPGPLFRFGDVAIRGRAPATADPADAVEQRPEDLGLVMGAIARSTAVLGSERALVDEWREQGYPKAEIARRDALANHPDSTLDVGLDVASGPRAVYGAVTVTGTEDMDPDFVAWMTGLEPGREYDPDDIDKAQKNLRRLQVFNASRIVEGETVAPDGSLPIEVNVAERPRRLVGGGASYSTVDGAGVEGYWEHRNLFGRAERLRFDARVGGVAGVDPTDFSYTLGATFTKPGVITPLTDLTASLTGNREVLEAYTDTTVRARVGLAHEFYEGVTGTAAANVEWAEIEDALDTRQFLLASLPADLIWDARDDELEPTSGFRARIGLEPFYEFEYENVGLIANLQGSAYWSFDAEDRFVLAARAGIGSIVGAPRDEIPSSRLFFAGGGGSVRGYAYRNIGPMVGDDVVGGRSYVEGSLELRARVTESIGIVPFVDAGSAFASSLPDFSEDIKIGVGIGLRYYTGLGPIRVDAAVPLNPGDDDPAFAVYIGLGQSF